MKKYTILKNWHYSLVLFERMFSWYFGKKEFKIDFKLSKECWYPQTDNNSHYNKLAGVCFGVFGIHKNSVRLCWMPNFSQQGKILLFGYVYDSNTKNFQSRYFCEVDVETKYTCILSLYEDMYEFDMDPIAILEMENNLDDGKFQKKTFPYFGGKAKAPHNIDVWVEMKKVK